MMLLTKIRMWIIIFGKLTIKRALHTVKVESTPQ